MWLIILKKECILENGFQLKSLVFTAYTIVYAAVV